MAAFTAPPYIVQAIKASDAMGGLPGWLATIDPGSIADKAGIVGGTVNADLNQIEIETTRGTLVATATDWILFDKAGNIYPCPDWLIQGIYLA